MLARVHVAFRSSKCGESVYARVRLVANPALTASVRAGAVLRSLVTGFLLSRRPERDGEPIPDAKHEVQASFGQRLVMVRNY